MITPEQMAKANNVLSGILAGAANPALGLHMLAVVCAKLCDKYEVSRDEFCNTLKRTAE